MALCKYALCHRMKKHGQCSARLLPVTGKEIAMCHELQCGLLAAILYTLLNTLLWSCSLSHFHPPGSQSGAPPQWLHILDRVSCWLLTCHVLVQVPRHVGGLTQEGPGGGCGFGHRGVDPGGPEGGGGFGNCTDH